MLCVCVHVCLCVCMCVCVCACVSACVYACVCMRVCMPVHACLCVCTCVWACVCACVCMPVCMHVHVCVCVCVLYYTDHFYKDALEAAHHGCLLGTQLGRMEVSGMVKRQILIEFFIFLTTFPHALISVLIFKVMLEIFEGQSKNILKDFS